MEFITDSITPFNDGDLNRVFAYSEAPAPATVITVLKSQAKLAEEECVTEEDWNILIQKKLPSISRRDGDSGFVLLIAPRISRNRSKRSKSGTDRNDEDEKDSQRDHETTVFETEESLGSGGQRQTRILPFSKAIFLSVSKAFYAHRSISPAINRADVPLFSHEELFMQDGHRAVKARIYNCRSTNAWGDDLAMAVTHFPECQLSFGILFGCTRSQKNYILERLRHTTRESAHPLLLPGVFAELEKRRHHIIFGDQLDKLESLIPESDVEGLLGQQQSKVHSNRQDKRTVYLDMLHLKHSLTNWSHQLNKMLEHARILSNEHPPVWDQISSQAAGETEENSINDEDASISECYSDTQSSTNSAIGRLEIGQDLRPFQEVMARTDTRIIKRLDSILEDYNDKIRECQTRFDGLTMTTQLFQGETSVLLALAASKDSRHMRTIALVTMVFLPGTFFATIFSMTFFNWQAEDGEETVSSLFWIYVAFSVAATVVTLLVYYYFVAIRSKKSLGSSALDEV
ncbi:hypothetical protein F5Y10DRAFT_251885 [Nemania abortiva]|nr:hypothetical protein F5Y10DRAFT_251885 [Nemania abortiva]